MNGWSATLLALPAIIAGVFLAVRVTTMRFERLLEESRFIVSAEGMHDTPRDPAQLSRLLAESFANLRMEKTKISYELETFKTIMEGLDEGILLIDADGRVLLANSSAERFFGPFPARIQGRHYIELIPVAEIDRALRLTRQDASPRTVEHVTEQPEKHLLQVDIRELPTGRYLLLVRDISQQRIVENMRRDFIANASHELRTPLTAIQGFSDTLLENDPPPERRAHFLRLIAHSAEHMSAIVNDMLLLSKIEYPEHPPQRRPIDLNDIASRVMETSEVLAAAKQITLEGDLKPAPMLGDAGWMEQVVGNLVGNAIRYTPEGGRIWVSTDTDISKGQGRKSVRLCVADNGIGVPEGERSRIFERFYRVDRGRSRVSGGTGLGLSIVRHIVTRHEGRVWVEERPGGGSRFICIFPVESDSTREDIKYGKRK